MTNHSQEQAGENASSRGGGSFVEQGGRRKLRRTHLCRTKGKAYSRGRKLRQSNRGEEIQAEMGGGENQQLRGGEQ
jgi:hypothetical protein